MRRNWFIAILIILSFAGYVDAATIGGAGVNTKDAGSPLGPAHTIDCTGDGIDCSLNSGTLSVNVDQAVAPYTNYYVAGHNSEMELIGSGGETGDTCRYGNCLNFDGTDDRVDVTDYAEFESNGDLTVAGWVYPTISQSGNMAQKGNGNVQWRAAFVAGSPTENGVIPGFRANNAGLVINTSVYIPLYKWSHIAWTVDEIGTDTGSDTEDILRCYVNGELVYEKTDANWSIPADGSNILRLGTYYSGAAYSDFFAGRMDTVAI